ncbi:hypothetical protein PInf_007067 [Phytophthora infestans]|nr:hypothetical protein PInf_007067 [Phytophthora infestans]
MAYSGDGTRYVVPFGTASSEDGTCRVVPRGTASSKDGTRLVDLECEATPGAEADDYAGAPKVKELMNMLDQSRQKVFVKMYELIICNLATIHEELTAKVSTDPDEWLDMYKGSRALMGDRKARIGSQSSCRSNLERTSGVRGGVPDKSAVSIPRSVNEETLKERHKVPDYVVNTLKERVKVPNAGGTTRTERDNILSSEEIMLVERRLGNAETLQ